MPSRYEPFGIVFVEAMSRGLPCVASDRCAMPEIVGDQSCGRIVPAEDPEALTDVLVELARDAALEMLPVNAAQVTAMIERLQLSKLLGGYRGKPPADRAALERTILGLARLYLDHRSVIRDIEITPLIIRPAGRGAIAVDVRVIWA